MVVSDVLKKSARRVVTASADMSVQKALALMDKEKAGVLVVVQDGRSVGIFSTRSCVRLCFDKNPALFEGISLGEAMTSKLISASPDEETDTIMDMMLRSDIEHLPVIDNDRLTGVVQIQDLMLERIQILEDELRSLKDYIEDLHEAGRD